MQRCAYAVIKNGNLMGVYSDREKARKRILNSFDLMLEQKIAMASERAVVSVDEKYGIFRIECDVDMEKEGESKC